MLDRIVGYYSGRLTSHTRFMGWHDRVSVAGDKVSLLKPSTFMNCSGQSVAACAGFYQIPPEQILVLHDELDLPPGTVRFKSGGGHGGHNGLRDIVTHLGSREFHRLRIGIGHPGHASAVIGYVLKRASQSDQAAINESIERSLGHIPDLLSGHFQIVMNELHSKS